jgi:predicted ATPase
MIESIEFKNFKALQDAVLPLNRFTLMVGANGTGKSTATHAIPFVLQPGSYDFDELATAGRERSGQDSVGVVIKWRSSTDQRFSIRSELQKPDKAFGPNLDNNISDPDLLKAALNDLRSFRVFAFNAPVIAQPVQTLPDPALGREGSHLSAVLDALSDIDPEKFEALNSELNRMLPEFDRILFETPTAGMKRFLLRTKKGQHRFRSHNLSDGTLFALAILTLAYLPAPPSIICFEEPDRGIHPRLLRDIQDAMYRLAFPESYGEEREPVQVIATTHSPYLLDLYKNNLDQVVISYKDDNGAHFERLSDKPHLEEIVAGAPLGEIWYSGVLGGVPSTP